MSEKQNTAKSWIEEKHFSAFAGQFVIKTLQISRGLMEARLLPCWLYFRIIAAPSMLGTIRDRIRYLTDRRSGGPWDRLFVFEGEKKSELKIYRCFLALSFKAERRATVSLYISLAC